MRMKRPSYANVAATAALALAIGGGTVAIGGVVNGDGEIQACFDKKGRGQGDLRLLVKGKCTRAERRITWNQEGPPGEAGSPDTPRQVLEKLAQVDGAGSGLDADALDGVGADGFARAGDAFTKAESDGRFVRTAPREVVVRAAGTPAENGQALRAALAGLPTASQTDPVAVRLTGGGYALGAGPLNVPSLVTLRGAGRRATVIDIVEPIGLGESSALEDLLVIGFSGSGPAVQVSQDDAQIDGVEVIRLGSGVAEALRVEGGEVTVRDSALSAGGDGGSTNVRAVNARGLTHLIDTDVEAFSGFGELRGILVENGSLDMVGGSIVVDDNETPGFTPVALRLAGGASTVRDTEIQAFNSDATGVHGVEVANTASSLSGISVRVSSSATDLAIEAAEDVTVERSQLVATGAGDVGIQTTDAGATARVATSRIAASTTAAGTGTESCVFSYGSAFNALSAACL